MNRLNNKVVLITGAAKGIGAATAQLIAAEGAKVIINYSGRKNSTGNTELYVKGKSPEMIARQAALNAFNRLAEVGDVAPVTVFLASDDAKWISGQTIGVNGAMA